MGGICGIIQLGGEPREVAAPEVLQAMAAMLLPDGRGRVTVHQQAGVAFAVAGGTPGRRRGAVRAVHDADLLNEGLLRADLQRDGFPLRSAGLEHTLAALHARDGAMFPRRLRGVFAVAVWDGRRRRAVLARDRLGVKTVYHARCGDLLVFGSEVKSVLASGLVPVDVDRAAVAAHLEHGHVPGSRTVLAAVRRLEPGHVLVVEDGSARSECFWRPPAPAARPPELSRAEAAELLLAALRESIQLHAGRRRPGVLLDGGLPSAVLAAVLADHSSTALETFSVQRPDGSRSGAPAEPRRVATTLGARHHELDVGDGAIDLEELVWRQDEPLADLSSVPFPGLCALAREQVPAALSAHGASALLGGDGAPTETATAGRWWRRRRRPDASPAGDRTGQLPAAGPQRTGCPGTLLAQLDRAAASADLTLRAPFLDHHVVELGAGLRARRLTVDRVLRDVARAVAPDLVVDAAAAVRTSDAALAAWFARRTARQLRDYLLAPAPRSAHLLDRATFDGLIAEHRQAPQRPLGRPLLALLLLEVWLQTYLPRATAAPARTPVPLSH
jgi:asparagine synthase (glutamine-hydrolysing)